MNTFHVDLKIKGDSDLVRDDIDRVELVRRTSRHLGPRLLAYCLMNTHLHLVVEAPEDELMVEVGQLMQGYTRYLNARRGTAGWVRKGVVNVIPKTDPGELVFAIVYDHKNPVRAEKPIVGHEVTYEWSSSREYCGLTRTKYANVERARALAGRAGGPLHATFQLENAERLQSPTALPPHIHAAVAQTYGLLAEELLSSRRSPTLTAARSTFMTLGRLEAFTARELAPWIGRSRSQANSLVSDQTDLEGVRIARTLLRVPELSARLRPLPKGDWRPVADMLVTQP